MFFLYLFGFFSIITFTSVLLVTQGLNAVAMAVHAVGVNLLTSVVTVQKRTSPKKKTSVPELMLKEEEEREPYTLDEMLLRCEEALAMIEATEGSYGSIAFDECAVTLFNSIMSLYWFLTCLIALAANGTNNFILSNTICNFMLCVVSIYRLYYTVSHGQNIEDEIATVVKILRFKIVKHSSELSPSQHERMTTLKENLQDKRGISPKKTFNLNLSMMLSALSTLMTYLIVLMQFKAGDEN